MTKTREDADGVDPNSIQEDVKTRQLGTRASEPGTEAPFASATTIGEYRIIRKIGEGGMGVVYEAEQKNPHRLVALKVIRGGLHTDDYHVKMFEREIEALARLKHPGIASIYESGRSDDGTVFFAMELVNGIPLSDFVERRRSMSADATPDVKSQLALFAQIGDVISHAHQRGVIHRDLKPQNILVTDDGDLGSLPGDRVGVKILDFGLARINDPDFRGNTGVSQVGQIKGTLLYMSPEQVRGRSDEIDVRSDVYALGVMLYEMLSGQMPYDLSQASLPEAMRIICEEPPKLLSKASTETYGRSTRIDRDVETIALKALEKEPDRRYQSVAAMLDDIERYQHNQPILARPPSAFYQFRKLVERHRVAFAALATIFLLVAGFGVVMAAQSVRIANERDKAEQARADAEEQKAQAEESRNDALAARNEEAKQRQIAVDNLTRAETAQKAEAEQRKIAEHNLREAQEQTAIAETEKREAEIASKQRSLAEERAVLRQKEAESQAEANRRLLYVSQINLAQQAWNQANVSEMRSLLDETKPRAGQSDLRGFEWYYLWRLAHQDEWTVQLPAGIAARARLSSNGKLVIVNNTRFDRLALKPRGYNDGTLLDIVSGKEVESIPGRHIYDLSPDGRTLAISSPDLTASGGEISLYDMNNRTMTGTGINCCSLSGVEFLPNGNLFVARADGAVEVWNLSERKLLAHLPAGKQAFAFQSKLSPDGKLLAMVGVNQADGSHVAFYDISTGRELGKLKGDSQITSPTSQVPFSSIAFSPDGSLFATGGDSVVLWESATRRQLAILAGPMPNFMESMADVTFSSDGRSLAANRGRVVEIYDVAQRQKISTIREGETVGSVSFSADGKSLLTSTQPNEVKLWRIGTSDDRNIKDQFGAAISPDGHVLATVSKQGDLSVRRMDDLEHTTVFGYQDPGNGRVLRAPDMSSIKLAKGVVRSASLRFSEDGRIIAVERGTSAGLYVEFFDAETMNRLAVTTGDVVEWGMLNDRPEVITVDSNGSARRWDLRTSTLVGSFPTAKTIQGREHYRAAISPDGRSLAFMVSDRYSTIIRILDTLSGRELIPPIKEATLLEMAFPQKNVLVVYTLINVRFLDTSNGRDFLPPIQSSPIPTSAGSPGVKILFSPNGTVIASASGKIITLIDGNTRQEIGVLRGHGNAIISMAFSVDGKRLASASTDGTVRVWDVQEKRSLLAFPSGMTLGLIFTPDSRSLVTFDWETGVHIRQAATDEEVAKQRGK